MEAVRLVNTISRLKAEAGRLAHFSSHKRPLRSLRTNPDHRAHLTQMLLVVKEKDYEQSRYMAKEALCLLSLSADGLKPSASLSDRCRGLTAVSRYKKREKSVVCSMRTNHHCHNCSNHLLYALHAYLR